MKKVKLGEITKIRTGKLDANASDTNGEYPFFTCSIKPLKINDYSYDCECVLVAGNGDLNVKYYNGKFDAYQRTYIIEVKEGKQFKTKYLYYLINNNIENLRKDAIGGVIKYIKLKNLTDIKVKNLCITEQEKIVNELDKVQEIIDIRKEQIEYLDELIKSQFVEMFGDVINNQKHFEYKRIDEISEIVTGTTPNTNDYSNWNGNIKWITPAEIDKNTFIVNDTERKITEEGRKSKSLTIMPKGTVLFTTRAPIGKTAITGDEMCCNQGFKNCICKKDINNIYLYFVLKYNANYFDCLGTGATFRELSKTNFSKIKISVPPIDLQNKFAEFIKQVDKQKFKIQENLEEIQKLQESLMNKYFG